MRIILKNSFFSVVCFLTVLFFGMSCQRENGPVEQEPGSPVTLESGEAALSFCVITPVVGVDTKSVITDTYFETGIRSILILVLGEDGSWKSTYKEASSGYLSTGTGVAALDLDAVKVRACYQDYTVYAFVNMGNVMDNMPVDASGKPTPDAYVYSLPVAYPDLGTRGMPMCAKVTVDTDDLPAGGQANVVLTLRRLMAKVVISVNKTGMTGENAGVLNSSIIRVRQVPRVIRPFAAGGSGALEVAELYGGVGAAYTDTDYYSFSAGSAAGAAYHTNVTTLYVPENYQGVGSETNQEKKATAPGETPTGRQALATFLEYKASKSGTNDGISGNLTYKAYLGENVVNDYNVIGDKVYRATLNLSWNGLFFDGDWRVDNSDITDSRRLYLSTTANASSASFDWGRLRRNVASQLYVNFSRDGGSTWVHSAKDIDAWPYGWDLYIDGVKQAAGAAATAAGDLGWSYIGDPSRDQLFITPGPSSVSSTPHTLQVKSSDGRIASNIVTFDVGLSPLGGKWMNDTAPLYVAQRGKILCYDPDNNPDELFIDADVHSTNPSKVAVVNNGDGTADVSILAPFAEGEVGIYIEDADGERRCDVEMEGLLPYWCFTNSDNVTTYVDGEFTKALSLSKTSATSGSEYISNRLYVTEDTYALNRYLNYNLVKSALAPEVNSDNLFVGVKSMACSSNNITLTMRLKTFDGLSFGTEESKIIDRLYLTMNTFGEERNAPDVSVIARNPFYYFSSTPTRGQVMNDYTLYKFPSNDYGWGTTEWSADNYTETASYTMTAPRVSVASSTNARFRAYFNDDGRVFGTAMTSGTPSTSGSSTLTYTMSGVMEGNITNHGAGRVNYNTDVVCPADHSVLTRTFGYGYVRLHAFVYGEVIWTTNVYRFYTKPRLLHGKPMANGNPIVPTLLNFNYCNALLAPTWPYITWPDSMGGSGEDPINNQTAIMGNDASGTSLTIYHEWDWLGENGDCVEHSWFLPEQMGKVSSSNQAAFLKACVRRSVIPYTFSPDYNTNPGSTTNSHPEFYRVSDYELQYDPTWTGARTYSLPSEVESNYSKRRLVVLHVIKGRTENNTGFVDDSYTVDTYQAAPENGNGGWYFSYANRTATWRH